MDLLSGTSPRGLQWPPSHDVRNERATRSSLHHDDFTASRIIALHTSKRHITDQSQHFVNSQITSLTLGCVFRSRWFDAIDKPHHTNHRKRKNSEGSPPSPFAKPAETSVNTANLHGKREFTPRTSADRPSNLPGRGMSHCRKTAQTSGPPCSFLWVTVIGRVLVPKTLYAFWYEASKRCTFAP